MTATTGLPPSLLPFDAPALETPVSPSEPPADPAVVSDAVSDVDTGGPAAAGLTPAGVPVQQQPSGIATQRPPLSLSGRKILIVGVEAPRSNGSRLELGGALATRLALQKAEVACASAELPASTALVALIREAGGHAVALAGRFDDTGQAAALLASATAALGGLDTVILGPQALAEGTVALCASLANLRSEAVPAVQETGTVLALICRPRDLTEAETLMWQAHCTALKNAIAQISSESPELSALGLTAGPLVAADKEGELHDAFLQLAEHLLTDAARLLSGSTLHACDSVTLERR